MAQSIDDINQINGTWQSLNVLSGIAVGTGFEVINKSNNQLLIMKGTEPAVGSTSGIPIAPFPYNHPNYIFGSGELEVWCRSANSLPSSVHCQVT